MMATTAESFMPGIVEKKYTFTLIPPAVIPTQWDKVSKLLEPAVEHSHGRWSMPALFDALYTERQQLWLGYTDPDEIKFALTTEIANYPCTKLLAIQFLGGDDYSEWSDDMTAMMERFAKDMGCSGVEAVARFGFWPMFKKRGYKRAYVTYELNFQGTH